MSGKIIEFRGRDLHKQAVLRLQFARISGLLEELEDLVRSADDQSSPHLLLARSTVERTRMILAPRVKPTASAGLETHDDDDPQPDVDRALLERMYRDINPIA